MLARRRMRSILWEVGPIYRIQTALVYSSESVFLVVCAVGGCRCILSLRKPFSLRTEFKCVNSCLILLSSRWFSQRQDTSIQPPTAHTTRKTDLEEYTNAVCIPYIGPTSHKIERILHRANIKVYRGSQMKMHQLLFSHKGKFNNVSKPGVYRIPCECVEVYIGETGRNLTTRQKGQESSVVKHAWEKGHNTLWKDCALVAPVRNYYSIKVRESIEILKHVTIQQEEKPLSDIWSTLFRY